MFSNNYCTCWNIYPPCKLKIIYDIQTNKQKVHREVVLCLKSLCLRPLLFPTWQSGIWALTCECKIDQANFIHWMSFLSSNLMKEISPNLEPLSTNTWSLSAAWNGWKDKNYLCMYKCFNIATRMVYFNWK